jgi:hypothetical protein
LGIGIWIALFAMSSLFWAWIIFLGGAEWITDGSWLRDVLVSLVAPSGDWLPSYWWSTGAIKWYAALLWIAETICFVIGIHHSELRHYYMP